MEMAFIIRMLREVKFVLNLITLNTFLYLKCKKHDTFVDSQRRIENVQRIQPMLKIFNILENFPWKYDAIMYNIMKN